jgi:hypothetical protein
MFSSMRCSLRPWAGRRRVAGDMSVVARSIGGREDEGAVLEGDEEDSSLGGDFGGVEAEAKGLRFRFERFLRFSPVVAEGLDMFFFPGPVPSAPMTVRSVVDVLVIVWTCPVVATSAIVIEVVKLE